MGLKRSKRKVHFRTSEVPRNSRSRGETTERTGEREVRVTSRRRESGGGHGLSKKGKSRYCDLKFDVRHG